MENKKSRQTIINEVKGYKENWFKEVNEVFEGDPPIREALILISHLVHDFVTEEKEFILVALQERAFSGKNDRQFNLDSEKHEVLQAMNDFLSQCAQSGQIIKLDYEIATIQFFSKLFLDSLRHVLAEDYNTDNDNQYINHFVDSTLTMWS